MDIFNWTQWWADCRSWLSWGTVGAGEDVGMDVGVGVQLLTALYVAATTVSGRYVHLSRKE